MSDKVADEEGFLESIFIDSLFAFLPIGVIIIFLCVKKELGLVLKLCRNPFNQIIKILLRIPQL